MLTGSEIDIFKEMSLNATASAVENTSQLVDAAVKVNKNLNNVATDLVLKSIDRWHTNAKSFSESMLILSNLSQDRLSDRNNFFEVASMLDVVSPPKQLVEAEVKAA